MTHDMMLLVLGAGIGMILCGLLGIVATRVSETRLGRELDEGSRTLVRKLEEAKGERLAPDSQVAKLEEEVEEWKAELGPGGSPERALEELADVVIVCMTANTVAGHRQPASALLEEVRRKVRRNARRTWVITDEGVGHHV